MSGNNSNSPFLEKMKHLPEGVIWNLDASPTELACLIHTETYEDLLKHYQDLSDLNRRSQDKGLDALRLHACDIVRACGGLRGKGVHWKDNSKIEAFYTSVISFDEKVESYRKAGNRSDVSMRILSKLCRAACLAVVTATVVSSLALMMAAPMMLSVLCGAVTALMAGALYYRAEKHAAGKQANDDGRQSNEIFANHPARLFSNSSRIVIVREYAAPRCAGYS